MVKARRGDLRNRRVAKVGLIDFFMLVAVLAVRTRNQKRTLPVLEENALTYLFIPNSNIFTNARKYRSSTWINFRRCCRDGFTLFMKSSSHNDAVLNK